MRYNLFKVAGRRRGRVTRRARDKLNGHILYRRGSGAHILCIASVYAFPHISCDTPARACRDRGCGLGMSRIRSAGDSNTRRVLLPAAQSSSWVWCLRKANSRVRRGMHTCSLDGRRARQPRCGRAGCAAYESHVLSLRWHLVYLDPLRELVLGLNGGEFGQHLQAHRLCVGCVAVCIWATYSVPCH